MLKAFVASFPIPRYSKPIIIPTVRCDINRRRVSVWNNTLIYLCVILIDKTSVFVLCSRTLHSYRYFLFLKKAWKIIVISDWSKSLIFILMFLAHKIKRKTDTRLSEKHDVNDRMSQTLHTQTENVQSSTYSISHNRHKCSQKQDPELCKTWCVICMTLVVIIQDLKKHDNVHKDAWMHNFNKTTNL